MSIIQQNFKEAPWFEGSEEETIGILGLGGIGSNTAYNLVKTLKSTILLMDFDKVEEHNVGSQFFWPKDIGNYKLHALITNLVDISAGRLVPSTHKLTEDSSLSQLNVPIMIVGFDNMAARKRAFELWKSNPDRQLFIDGRLRATQYEIFCVHPTKRDVETYEKTLFDDNDIPDEPCTFKQTSYAAMLLGARITSFVVNYLSNAYSEEEVAAVPFFYKELLELCYTEMEEFSKDMPGIITKPV